VPRAIAVLHVVIIETITDETSALQYSCNVAFAWKSTPKLQASEERSLKILRGRNEARAYCVRRCSAAKLARSGVIFLVYNLISVVDTLVNNDAMLWHCHAGMISSPEKRNNTPVMNAFQQVLRF
jgi:hypothetical protein